MWKINLHERLESAQTKRHAVHGLVERADNQSNGFGPWV